VDPLHQNTVRRVNTRKCAKEAWQKVRRLTKSQPLPGLTAQVLNSHYADVSSDSKYTPPPVKQTASPPCSYVTEIEVFRMLDRLKPTATGLDTLPAWFLRLSAPVIAAPQTHTVQLVHQMCSDSTPMEENMHHTHPEGCTPSRGE